MRRVRFDSSASSPLRAPARRGARPNATQSTTWTLTLQPRRGRKASRRGRSAPRRRQSIAGHRRRRAVTCPPRATYGHRLPSGDPGPRADGFPV